MNIQGLHPGITAPLQAGSAAKPLAATGTTGTSSGTSSSTSGTSASSLQQTFLNLLVTELQNQDPTAPVDPTAMVGQLVSLNQLDQLISINSTLSSLVPSSTAAGSSTQSAAKPAVSGSNTTTSNPGAAALGQLQPAITGAAGSTALMNLYGSSGATAQNSN
jgi:flagellar basal-body rod modification protein FlgD